MKYLVCYEVKYKLIEGSIAGHAVCDLKFGLTEQAILDTASEVLNHTQTTTRTILSHTVFRSFTKIEEIA